MAFVDVPHGGLELHRGKRARATDAEHQILLEPRRAVAAVETVRNRAIALVVLRYVGVEEKKPNVADARLPDLHGELAARKGELHREIAAAFLHRLDRQVAELGIVIVGALAPLGIDRLDEVALAIEEAHRHERQLEVTRRLAMVSGEDAEAAGVERQALVHA